MKLKKRFFYFIDGSAKQMLCFLLSLVCCCSLMGGSLSFAASNAGSGANAAGTGSGTGTAGSGQSANAASSRESWPQGPAIEGEAAIVMDVTSGTVLYEKNPHQQLYPASITKILTALLAVEGSQMDEQVTFSYNAVHRTEGSGIWRDVDEVMTMEQCLYALMLNSANECAYAIAEHVGGTYEDFVQLMNDRAEALGCTDTNFNNPHGLPDEEHYTSCYDMALIAREAIQNETFRQLVGTKRYQIPPTNKHPDEITYLKNHHKMLFADEKYYYEYCIGGKNGYTEAAGNTLVTYAEKDGMTLVCVTMKEKITCQYEDSIKLLDFCFDNFSTYNIAENLTNTHNDKAAGADYLSGGAFADIDKNAAVVLPKGVDFSEAAMEVVCDEEKENVAGVLQYTYAGRVVGTAEIVQTQQDVTEYPFDSRKGENGQEETQGENEVIHINLKAILLVILGILVAAAGGILVCRYRFEILDLLHGLRFGRRSGRDLRRRRRRQRRRRRRRGRRR